MDDREILSRIHELVDDEDRLNAAAINNTLSEQGHDPDDAHPRPVDTVEHYAQ